MVGARSLIVLLTMLPIAAMAQATGDCRIKQAANAAVQRQIALIDAAKVSPSDFFNGPNACISTDLLKQMDLSKLIPDLSGFLQAGAESAMTNVLNAAKQKVCSTLNNQLQQVVGQINANLTGFQSSLGSDFASLLNGQISTISVPNISGIGQFNLNPISNSSLTPVNFSGASSPPPVAPINLAPSQRPPSPPPPQGGGPNFGNIFR